MNAVVQHSLPGVPEAQALSTPLRMLEIAVSQNADIAKLEKLMELHQRWEANEARKAFVEALANFKRNPPKVIKDLTNKQYSSKYASLGSLVNTVNAALGEHGLNARWSLSQGDQIEVTCILSHMMGHSESVSLKSGPDTSGAKNPLQQIKSAITYLEGATFQAITGIVASSEGDDDGNGSGKPPGAPPPAPEGYENWACDMEATAEEGTAKLLAAWEGSKGEFRRYAVKNEAVWWAATKSKASKAKVQS